MICAVDFSDPSMEALNFAARFAGDYGAELTVIHVVEVDPVHVLTDVKFKKFAASLMREAEARLSEMLSTSGVPTETKALVKQGKPQAIVEELIQKTGCDLLVAGTRGMHLPRQGGIGSTANAFLRSVPVPVLLVP
jgi:nucleotide-binding universal stress UspA family protein